MWHSKLLTTILAWWAFFDFSIFFFFQYTFHMKHSTKHFLWLKWYMHSKKFYQFLSLFLYSKKLLWVVIWKKKILMIFVRNKKSQITTRIFFYYFHFLKEGPATPAIVAEKQHNEFIHLVLPYMLCLPTVLNVMLLLLWWWWLAPDFSMMSFSRSRNKKSQITTRIPFFYYFHFLLKNFIKKICLSFVLS